MAAPALEVENLSAGYAGMTVLWDINLKVLEGQSVVILGANGAGKSTLLRSIVGLLPVATGRVSFFGHDVTHLSVSRRMRRGVAFMSEQGIFPSLTIKENLQLGAMNNRDRSFEDGLGEVFDIFPDLKDRMSGLAGSLSGGQRKMLGVAKCVISEPKLLVMDEPSSGLSPKFVSEVVDVLEQLHESGLTLLVAEQNIEFMRTAHLAVVVEGGRIRFQGEISELESDQALHEAFFGIAGVQGV